MKKTNISKETSFVAHLSDDEDAKLPSSKTQLKAQADALQALGVRLCALSKEKLSKLSLPDTLLEAVRESKKITSNGAIRRHRQYLGRLMRDIDTTFIEEQLAKWDGKNRTENAYFHGLERWRDRMLSDTNTLSEFIAQYPNILPEQIQQMRMLIRNAQKELMANKPPKSSRELFKLLRQLVPSQHQRPDEAVADDEYEA